MNEQLVKHQELMFYPLGKNSEKPQGWWWHPPPPLYVRGLIDLAKAKSEASAYILKVKATNCNIINCQPLTGNVQILATLL